MKKFKFRLEKVLQYREALKAEAKRELMLCNLALQQAESELGDLEQAFLAVRIEVNAVMYAEELQSKGQYSARLKAEMTEQLIVIEKAKLRVQEATDKYLEAIKEAKTLSKLKEKRLAEHLDLAQKQEQILLDERATFRGNLMDKQDFN